MGKVCAIGALCSGCGKQPVPSILQPHRQQIKNGKETGKNEKINIKYRRAFGTRPGAVRRGRSCRRMGCLPFCFPGASGGDISCLTGVSDVPVRGSGAARHRMAQGASPGKSHCKNTHILQKRIENDPPWRVILHFYRFFRTSSRKFHVRSVAQNKKHNFIKNKI